MLKILYFTNYPEIYGANSSLIDFIINIRDNNILPIVVCPQEGDFTTQLKILGVKYYIVRFHINCVSIYRNSVIRRIVRLARYIKNIIFDYCICLKELKKIIRENDVDLIHTNSFCMNIGATAARKCHIPHIWHIREFLEEDYNLHRVRTPYFKRLVKSTAKFVIISEAVRNKHKNTIGDVPYEVIYNGIEVKDKDTPNIIVKSDKKIFLILGVIQQAKGFHEAVEAACILWKYGRRDFELWIAGGVNDQQYLDKLRQTIKKYDAEECVKFLGYRSDVKSLMQSCYCGLMCSKLEGLGRTTVEFMLSGKPVIGANTGGTLEIIQDGKNGLLYAQGNTEELADKMKFILDNPNAVSDMGEYAVGYAKNKFSISNYVDNILKLYKGVLNEGDI